MQLSLFAENLPLAARNDPETSHQAAEEMVQTGRLAFQHKQTLEALRKFPGLTSEELSYKSGLDYHAVARRLPDLEKLGKAFKGPNRICKRSSRNRVTWYATSLG